MRKLIQIVLINHAWNMQRTVAWFKIERGIIYLKLKNAWLYSDVQRTEALVTANSPFLTLS
jgi:hypothetical protein